MAPRDVPPAAALALAALVLAMRRGREVFPCLSEQAGRQGVREDSDEFDAAAELAGVPYCRALDLYVDRETKARAEGLHFTEAHLALAR